MLCATAGRPANLKLTARNERNHRTKMTRFTILLLFTAIIKSAVSQGQTFERYKGETANKFVQRITAVDNLAYDVIETNEWDSTKKVLIAFIPTPDEITVGLVFIPIDSFTYKQVLIDSFSTSGNTARINNVFLYNADNDKPKELIVMTTFDKSQNGQLSKIYWNLVFDNPNLSSTFKRFNYLKQASKKVDGNFFTKPSDIKAELNRLNHQ